MITAFVFDLFSFFSLDSIYFLLFLSAIFFKYMFISHQFFNVCTLAFFVSTVGHVTDTGNTCTCFH